MRRQRGRRLGKDDALDRAGRSRERRDIQVPAAAAGRVMIVPLGRSGVARRLARGLVRGVRCCCSGETEGVFVETAGQRGRPVRGGARSDRVHAEGGQLHPDGQHGQNDAEPISAPCPCTTLWPPLLHGSPAERSGDQRNTRSMRRPLSSVYFGGQRGRDGGRRATGSPAMPQPAGLDSLPDRQGRQTDREIARPLQ